jgi:hypothetical protein
MRTRAKSGFFLPTRRLNFLASFMSVLFLALIVLLLLILTGPVPWATNTKPLFRMKLGLSFHGPLIIVASGVYRQHHVDGSLARYKARWVVCGLGTRDRLRRNLLPCL